MSPMDVSAFTADVHLLVIFLTAFLVQQRYLDHAVDLYAEKLVWQFGFSGCMPILPAEHDGHSVCKLRSLAIESI